SEDERRRYVFESVRVPAANGVQLQAQVVRPKNSARAMPALLEFTIHHDSTQSAAAPAAHGYAGVIAFTRATQNPPALALPFEFDGEDAVAVIAWIAQQPWNDGNVAMIGEGYSGFTAWAAAARAPPALKAIATADPMAPGIDMPMSGNIFHNEAYRWAQRVTGRSDGQAKPGDDGAAWAALDRAWFTSGRRYRDLDNLNGARNPFFERWLNHPSYDRYWQKMIPFREGFAQVRIPALTVTGYYSANQSGALYYFDQHLRYLPSADHRLLVGPYVQGGGEPAESAAQLDLTQLRYQWLDHVFKGTQRPAPLEDRVNFITQGVDQWRHADSLRTMSNGVLRFYLDAQITAGGHLLAQRETPNDTFVSTQLSMRDRSETNTATTYISAPLAAPTDLAGEIRGRIELLTNKQDVDLTLAIYELRANGEFVMLFDPAITFRASYAADRVRRRLLKAGRRQQIEFRSERLMSRRLAAGSRLMLVLGVNKRPDQQINYGAGNDVSEESIADARTPMRLRWYGGSYVELPIREP
ncbi:MAG: CocE/NonD family hydrolase, partial [Nevskiaceae bacterium]|nr:CocE/NonD family hydrolase [Nevskiaceae bacterium]